MDQYPATSWADPRIIVKHSDIQGQGGFAGDTIQAGEIVVRIGGTVMTEAEFQTFAATAAQYDAIQIDEDLHLVDLSPDPRATNGSINHSCDANLWMHDATTLVARRDILPGEELTVDYALFTALPTWILDTPCQCGTPTCRHTITGNDWQLPEVQARYQDHFSPFINHRIAKGEGHV